MLHQMTAAANCRHGPIHLSINSYLRRADGLRSQSKTHVFVFWCKQFSPVRVQVGTWDVRETVLSNIQSEWFKTVASAATKSLFLSFKSRHKPYGAVSGVLNRDAFYGCNDANSCSSFIGFVGNVDCILFVLFSILVLRTQQRKTYFSLMPNAKWKCYQQLTTWIIIALQFCAQSEKVLRLFARWV